MSDYDHSLELLTNDILASDIYLEYECQLNRVKQHPELKAQIDDYRRRNYELQTNEDTALEQIDEFEKSYVGFRENPLVSDFLAAELALCRMLQDINLKLMEAVRFE